MAWCLTYIKKEGRMNTIVIGSVVSSRIVLEELIHAGIPVLKVFSLDETYSKNVSGYDPIHKTAEKHGIPVATFHTINSLPCVEEIERLSADYIFVVGLSQIVGGRLIRAAKKGVIGFHPTALPQYRGRAAMVWQVLLGVTDAKCTLFFIDEGMDSGPILGQEPYRIGEEDYASDIEKSLCEALRRLCRRVFEGMKTGTLHPEKQDESQATYLLKRIPEDGEIDWNQPIEPIYRLIRGTSRPYPGAFSYYDGEKKLIIWHAKRMENTRYIGQPGQIAEVRENSFDVLCKDGLLQVDEYEAEGGCRLLAGHRLKAKT